MHPNLLTKAVIGCAIQVHRELGPGHEEIAYERALVIALTKAGIRFQTQRPLPVDYKGIRLDCGYRVDFVVDDRLVVEGKAVEVTLPIHEAQLLTYLRIGHWQLGLLINFNEAVLKDGIRRRILGSLEEPRTPVEEGQVKNTETQRTQRGDHGLTECVIAAALEVHRVLGPGLLASAYRSCLCRELRLRGLGFELELPISLEFDGKPIPGGAMVEILVEKCVVLKIVATEKALPVHHAQLLTQLRFSDKLLGLLFNFTVPVLSQGIKRCIWSPVSPKPVSVFSAPPCSVGAHPRPSV